jgi:nitroimidazol reductase NimA-like FMN-containing flavoprotein (pyridoxamine 5'-phosphate oxidase superfamily)
MFTPEIITFMEETVIPLRLACVTKSGWPVTLSLWYVYLDGAIYCATQQSARVVRYLENEARCGFEIASDLPPYCGMRGQARAVIEPKKGADVLEILLNRYLDGTENQLAQGLLSKKDKEVAIRIAPVNITTWNFKDRMQDVAEKNLCKPCIED